MRVALVDPLWSGHHPTYLTYLAHALATLGHEAVIFCPEPAQMATLLGPARPDAPACAIEPYVWPRDTATRYNRRTDRRIALQRLQHLRTTLQQFEQRIGQPLDLVFFPCMDLYLGNYQSRLDWSRGFRWPFTGIYFMPRHLLQTRRLEAMRRLWFDPANVLHARTCRGCGMLDEYLVEPLARRLPGRRVLAWPDITDETCTGETDLSARVREKAGGRTVIGLLGSIATRKGVGDLLQMFNRLPPSRYFLLIAGSLHQADLHRDEWDRLQKFAAQPPENCLIHLQRVPDGQAFNSLVKACDLLWLVYRDFPYSSNMLTKAAVFRVPVMVARGHLMGQRTQQYSLGIGITEGDTEEAVNRLMDPRTMLLKETAAFQEGCATYARQHSMESLVKAFHQITLS